MKTKNKTKNMRVKFAELIKLPPTKMKKKLGALLAEQTGKRAFSLDDIKK